MKQRINPHTGKMEFATDQAQLKMNPHTGQIRSLRSPVPACE